MNKPTCDQCIFLDNVPGENIGFCNRFPPTNKTEGLWLGPMVGIKHWCGEFRSATEPEPLAGQVRLGDIKAAAQIAGIKKSQIQKLIADGKFPKPVFLGARCTRYPLHEVEQWVKAKLNERKS